MVGIYSESSNNSLVSAPQRPSILKNTNGVQSPSFRERKLYYRRTITIGSVESSPSAETPLFEKKTSFRINHSYNSSVQPSPYTKSSRKSKKNDPDTFSSHLKRQNTDAILMQLNQPSTGIYSSFERILILT